MRLDCQTIECKHVNNKWELIDAYCLNHKSVFANLVLAACLTDAITLISKDEVEGSTISKNEANQVT